MPTKKSLNPEETFLAGDETILQELLHPKNDSVDCQCSVAHASLEAGQSSLPHHLEQQTEIFYFLKGSGRVHTPEQTFEVRSGDLIHIPPKTEQWVENKSGTPLSFLCIVQPPWRAVDEVIFTN